MQTRRCRQAAVEEAAVDLPEPLQLQLLDILLLQHQHPEDREEYELWPYKSSLCWLMSLQHVCKAWRAHIRHSSLFVRRCRLERCKQLCLLHDYATLIGRYGASGRSKAVRLKAVPRWLELRFEDGSCTRFSVPRAKQQAVGLPCKALVLATACDGLTEAAFIRILHDLDYLDKGQAASPLVLRIVDPRHAGQASSSTGGSGGTEPQLQPQREATTSQHQAASEAVAAGPGSAEQQQFCYASSMQQLVAAAAPLLQRDGPLADIVMERWQHSPACPGGSLCFIPTGQSFTRSVPHGAAAAEPTPQQ